MIIHMLYHGDNLEHNMIVRSGLQRRETRLTSIVSQPKKVVFVVVVDVVIVVDIAVVALSCS